MTPWKRVSSAKQTNTNLALYSIVCCTVRVLLLLSAPPGRPPLKGVDASFRDSVFVCFLLLPSDHSIQRTSPSLFRKCTSHTLAARVAILLPFFPHHVGPTPSFSAPSCVRCHQSTPSARCIGCRSLPHGTHLSCAQLENRKGVRVSAQPHQPTPHLLHVILHST